MGKVVLDAATREKLGGLREEVELYDEAGNLIGVCRPAWPSIEEIARMPWTPGSFAPFTDEEVREGMDSLLRGERGITTAELLAKLRAL